MQKVEALKVVEIRNASSVYLGTDPETRGKEVRCTLHYVPGPRELDDYHLSGVYGKAGVPFAVEEVLPNNAEQPEGNKAYQILTRAISDAVYEGLTDGKAVFVTGGTCVSAPGVAGGLRRAFGPDARLGIIWMDAHGDLNIPETSPSGMLGGMPFATVLGLCLEDWRQSCGLEPSFEDRFALLTDARSFDKEEAENIKNLKLTVMDTAAFCDEVKWREQVQKLADQVDALYLHIDADIVDYRYLPSVNTPEPNGPDIRTLLRNIRIVMETGKVPAAALASIYFGSKSGETDTTAGSEIAILSGIRMIGTILENWQHSCDVPSR